MALYSSNDDYKCYSSPTKQWGRFYSCSYRSRVQGHFRFHIPMYIIALPMLVPQLSLLFGLQITSLWINQEHYWFWVVWAHTFCFSLYLSCFRRTMEKLPNRLSQTAVSLGVSPLKHSFDKITYIIQWTIICLGHGNECELGPIFTNINAWLR